MHQKFLPDGSRCFPYPYAASSDPAHCSGTWISNGRPCQQFSFLIGGTGLAPALQFTRAYFQQLSDADKKNEAPEGGIKIVYAADSSTDLAFLDGLKRLHKAFPILLEYYVVLNDPPADWKLSHAAAR